MVAHQREPTITVASVEAALESLKYTTRDVTAARSLHGLTLVETFLDDPAVPVSPLMRDFALHRILTDLIIRHYLSYSPAPLPAETNGTEQAVYARIRQDVKTENPEIIGWSLLYHLYVVTTPALLKEDYAQHASLDPRTVYRYKKNTLTQLTYALIQEEWHIRRQRHRQRLLALLPAEDGLPLIGRDDELAQIDAVLTQMPYPCIGVSGPPGCGKSALVWEAVKRLIAQDRAAYLFWVNSPSSLTGIEEQIRAYLRAARLRSTFTELVAAYPVVVILENTECVQVTAQEWDDLLSLYFGRTITFITGQTAHLTARAGLQVALRELDRPAVSELVRVVLKTASRDMTSADTYADAVWNRVGGNPAAVRLAVNLMEEDALDLFQIDILNRLYARVDVTLDRAALRLWDVLTLFPQGLSAAALRQVAVDTAVMRLRQQGILVPVAAGRYALSQSARLYRQAHPCDGLAWAWTVLEQDTEALWGWLAREVLAARETTVSEEMVKSLLHQYLVDMDASPALWRAALERWQTVLDLPLQLAYARSVFYGGDIQGMAESLVLAVIHQAGRVGDFALQAAGLLFYSAMCRQQGRYNDVQRALDHVNRVKRLPEHLQTLFIQERLHVALDHADHAQVADLLPLLTGGTAAVQVLRLEALILLGQHAPAEALAERLRRDFPDEEAWVLTILGRSTHDNQQFASAVAYFQAALLCFEQRQDVRAITRAQMNLAAALLALNPHEHKAEAKALLDTASHTAALLQDRVGLSALRVNWDYLSRINRLNPYA